MRPTPYVASLRIYEPMDAFKPVDQLRWKAIALWSPTIREEQNRALARTVALRSTSAKPDGAHIIEIDGRRYVSPWSSAVRCWTAMEDFKESVPAPLAKFFIPSDVESFLNFQAEAENLEDKVSYIINETWMIPPRWFSLFLPEERDRGINEDGPYTTARTSIKRAKERCTFTHQTVVQSFGNGPIEQEIADLIEWMDIFHPESLVELDYGGLAGYLDGILRQEGEDGLNADTSFEDIHLSLSGLAEGDGQRAGQGYERLISRWRKVAALESAF